MQFSIITTCLNEEEKIEKTIQSVLSQKEEDYEYLILDGGSTDRTKEICTNYQEAFQKKGVRFTFLDSKDSGIYDAMNQAARYAKGEWILYLGAGDYFVNANVLRDVHPYCEDAVDVLYGDGINYYICVEEPKAARELISIKENMPFCHGSAFTRRKVLEEYQFELAYRIAADYDLYLRLYLAGYRFQYVPVQVSYFSTDGISYTKSYQREREFLRIRKQNGVLSSVDYYISQVLNLRFLVIDIGKMLLGKERVIKYKQRKIAKQGKTKSIR